MFGTANFFNFLPFAAAVELLLDLRIAEVAHCVDGLVVRLLNGIDRRRYEMVSDEDVRSSLVVVRPLREAAADLYNTDDIDQVLSVL